MCVKEGKQYSSRPRSKEQLPIIMPRPAPDSGCVLRAQLKHLYLPFSLLLKGKAN